MTDRPLWAVEAMVAAMRTARNGPLPPSVPGISIDTRTIAPGEAFFAIKGDNRDGHDFVQAALAAGAGLAVVSADRRESFSQDAPLLIVADVLAGLRDLARAARARSRAKVIAVTGSVGKTGTKEALRLTLVCNGETHASLASYNNHWGVPLSLARCPESARYAVFELGMNHAGEIEPLTRLVRPQVAIITTVEPVHLEFFGSLEAIADAKAEIFLGLERGGAAVINRDNPQFARLERSAQNAKVERIVSFGEHARADARLMKCSLQSDTSTVQARIFGTDVTYKLGAPGRHLVLNSLAVLATAVLVGAGLARPREHRPARPAYRGARRHAGTRPARRRVASRTGHGSACARCRSRILLRAADARAVGGASHPAQGRLCRDRGAARSARAWRGPAGRPREGQGIARFVHGAHRQGAAKPLSPRDACARARSSFDQRLTHALLALRILGHDRSPERFPLHHGPHRGGAVHRARVRLSIRSLDHRSAAAQAGQGPADP